MMEAADIVRVTRDWNAGFAANDNLPIYDHDELVYPWMQTTRAVIVRAFVLSLALAVAIIGGCIAFEGGHSAGQQISGVQG